MVGRLVSFESYIAHLYTTNRLVVNNTYNEIFLIVKSDTIGFKVLQHVINLSLTKKCRRIKSFLYYK